MTCIPETVVQVTEDTEETAEHVTILTTSDQLERLRVAFDPDDLDILYDDDVAEYAQYLLDDYKIDVNLDSAVNFINSNLRYL